MKKITAYIISFYFWSELFGSSVVLFPVALLIWMLTLPFDRRRYLLHQFSCFWSNLVLGLNPLWKVRIQGREKIDRKETYVIVSNHQSGADILMLYALRLHFKWVSKRSLFFFPFIGWNMAMNRYIALRRGKKSSMHRMMEKSRRTIQSGNSMMIFPEGTRTKDGRVQKFKSGAFRLALDMHTPILPVAIEGTFRAIAKGGFLISRAHDLRITILSPVPFESFKSLDPKKLAGKIEKMIADAVTSGR